MRRDSRLCVALHVLLHLSEADGAVTSESLAPAMNTNPVVFRRTMAGLRDAGIVRSEKGHGGGWSLGRPLRAVTLDEVYGALGLQQPFSIGYRDAAPECALEHAVNRVIGLALRDAESRLMMRFRGITVADIMTDARRSASRRVKGRARAHA